MTRGRSIGTSYVAEWRKYFLVSKLVLPSSTAELPFPQAWVLIDRISRNLKKHSERNMWETKSQAHPNIELILKINADAFEWVNEARRHNPDEAPAPETSLAFAAWLQGCATHQFFCEKVAKAVKVGMERAIQYAASSPRAAALIPALYYQELGEQRTERYHQMLGNTGSSQTAKPVERDEILLLQLKSDDSVNFMFCDVGEAEFWINKHDLAARRFDRVFATTC